LYSFHLEGEKLLKNFPDYNEIKTIDTIKKKSQVLYLGMDLEKFDEFKVTAFKNPLIVWNHRWEYDKNPESFFKCMFELKDRGAVFNLAILGESFSTKPSIFDEAKTKLSKEIVHFGYCNDFSQYATWLCKADILPVTNNQDFFGGSIVEAIYCGAFPILPKRLSYPELLPKERHKTHLYEREKELVDMIEDAISNIKKTRKVSLASDFKRFDWKNMNSKYDQLFSTILDQHKN